MKDIVPTYCVSLYCDYKKYIRVYLNVKVVNQNTILGKALKKKKLLKSWDQKLSKIVKNSQTHREKKSKIVKVVKNCLRSFFLITLIKCLKGRSLHVKIKRSVTQ